MQRPPSASSQVKVVLRDVAPQSAPAAAQLTAAPRVVLPAAAAMPQLDGNASHAAAAAGANGTPAVSVAHANGAKPQRERGLRPKNAKAQAQEPQRTTGGEGSTETQ
jgi:hypothetical protein